MEATEDVLLLVHAYLTLTVVGRRGCTQGAWRRTTRCVVHYLSITWSISCPANTSAQEKWLNGRSRPPPPRPHRARLYEAASFALSGPWSARISICSSGAVYRNDTLCPRLSGIMTAIDSRSLRAIDQRLTALGA